MMKHKEAAEVRTGSHGPAHHCRQCGDPVDGGGFCPACREAARHGCLWIRSRRRPAKACIICSTSFRPNSEKQEACGQTCGRQLAKRRSDVARTANAMAARIRECHQCGEQFVAGNPSGKARRGEVAEGKYCSRKCSSDAVRIYPNRAAARRAEYERRKARDLAVHVDKDVAK